MLLGALRYLMAVYFIVTGIIHFTLPEGLPPMMSWMYDLSPILHYTSGAAEILGGLGLVLPAHLGLPRRLTPLAAIGLAVVMVLAALWHVPRGEMQQVGMTLVLACLMGYIAYSRWKGDASEGGRQSTGRSA